MSLSDNEMISYNSHRNLYEHSPSIYISQTQCQYQPPDLEERQIVLNAENITAVNSHSNKVHPRMWLFQLHKRKTLPLLEFRKRPSKSVINGQFKVPL